MTNSTSKTNHIKSKKWRATPFVLIPIAMFCFTFAAFPLYSIFCKVTGYGGTPKIAESLNVSEGDKTFIVRFNSDKDQTLDWNFRPMQYKVSVKTGVDSLIFYEAENISNETITGMATYNVTPDAAAAYFNKIQCFCFNEQTLKPHEKVTMPVSFFIDPAIEKDPFLKDLETITLSYTFFPAVTK